MCRVSIPNGMEFYKKAGMLCRMLSTVSIPNGMEFYRSLSIANISIGYCFNSQRDGILPFDAFVGSRKTMFQFPTGWNSTLLKTPNSAFSFWFQFPTGWNSTEVIGNIYENPEICFNSQRDGILRSRGIKPF